MAAYPWRARLPWFAVWVPMTLLFYLLVNGAGHMAALCKVHFVEAGVLDPLKPIGLLLWSPWVLLIAPCLAVFALVSWKTCPQWSPSIRWASGMLGLFFACVFLLIQVWLIQAPFGWPPITGTLAEQGRILAWIWRPHWSRPGLEASPRDLAALLDHPSPKVRWFSAQALGKLNAKEFSPDIARLLKDPNRGVREYAVRALGQLGAKEFVPEIAKLLGDSSGYVRQGAVQALDRLSAREFAPQIVGHLGDSDEWTRCSACCAMMHLGAKECIPQISGFLNDPRADVRAGAADTLGQLSAKESVPDIAKLLGDSDWMVRSCAVQALGELGAKEFAPGIAKLLEDPDESVRICSFWALGSLRGQRFASDATGDTGILAAKAWWAQHKNDPEYLPK